MTAPASMICVLGMHRSGTSLATRALHLLGVSLGPDEHLMRPRADNPLGFFEHQPLTDLNDEILWRLGGCWHTPPAFQDGWAISPALDDLRQRARVLLDEDFGELPLWGWKDPRTCLTLPFWLPLLPPARFIICLRNPLDVARSLQTRDGFSLERGAQLWVDHLGSALQHSTGVRRLFVSYDDLVERPDAELARMAAFVGSNAAPPLAGESAGTPLTDATLRHHHTQLTAVLDDESLAFPAKALYLALLLHRDGIDAQREDDYGSAVDRLAASARFSQAETLGQHAANERQSQQLVDITAAAQTAAAQAESVRLAAEAWAAERDQALNVVATLRTEIDLLKAGLKESHAAARALGHDLSRLQDVAQRTNEALHHAQAQERALADARFHLEQRLQHTETIGGWLKTGLRALLPAPLYLGLRDLYSRRLVSRR